MADYILRNGTAGNFTTTSTGTELNILTGVTIVNSAVLVTDAGGVRSFSTTLPVGLTIPGYIPSATAATAGKVLISNGSAYVASTSIWPNTVGTAGQIIRSDGTSNLYTTATYPATTTINRILYSTANNVIGEISSNNNGVLVTGVSGIPSISSTLPTGLTIPGYALSGANADITSMTGLTGTLQAPTGITSSAGANLLTFTYIASAVNYFDFQNNSAGSQPTFSVLGSDSNISMLFQAKGAGNYVFLGTSTQAANIKLREDTDNGSNSVGIRAPSALAADYNMTLPDAVGATNTVLKATDGTGTLAFTNGSQILGTATNDSATAGNIGEFISSSILIGSPVSLSTGSSADITSISLTAGDWDVSGMVVFNPNAATTTSRIQMGINTTSATLPTLGSGNNIARLELAQAAGAFSTLGCGSQRISVASTTTVYLVAQASFAVNVMSAYGFIGARRVR